MKAFAAFLLFLFGVVLLVLAVGFAAHLWRQTPDQMRQKLGRRARPQLGVGPQRLYIEAALGSTPTKPLTERLTTGPGPIPEWTAGDKRRLRHALASIFGGNAPAHNGAARPNDEMPGPSEDGRATSSEALRTDER